MGAVVFMAMALVVVDFSPAWAQCDGANTPDCKIAAKHVVDKHEEYRPKIKEFITKEFNKHRDWFLEDFAKKQVIPALQRFTEQMSAVAMQQTAIIGTFLDAKNQMEAQRTLQELQAEVHKDYQPSESFCTFGTSVRSLAHSESVGRYNAMALSRRQQARHLGQKNIGGAESPSHDKRARWTQFTENYCDPQDNNWNGTPDTGLSSVCNAPDSDRINIDVDYTRLIENRRSIDLNAPYFVEAPDELDIMSLGNNLYGHDVLFRQVNRSNINQEDMSKLYLALRSVAAKRSVAENSFNAIVGMKTLGSSDGLLDPGTAAGATQTHLYLGAILTELGIPEEEAVQYLGLGLGSDSYSGFNPSYYAQLELLAKKIYQNPDFYANLYDKPANIKRKSAALKAIELMLDRAIYESQLRQEMAMSVLLASRLRPHFKDIDKDLGTK